MSSRSQWSFPSIVGGGDNATILHYKNNDQIVKSGELVLVDAGHEVNGDQTLPVRPVTGQFTQP